MFLVSLQLSPSTMPRSAIEPITSPVSFRLPDSEVLQTRIDHETGRHVVDCDRCGKTIQLTKYANMNPLINHRKSSKCTRRLRRALLQAKDTVMVSTNFL